MPNDQDYANNGHTTAGNNDPNGNAAGIRKRTIILIEGAAKQGDAVVDKTETELLDGAGLGETEVFRYKHADGCGHLIHTASEVGGVSVCGKVLCTKCANNICNRCGKPVCGEHIRWVRKRGATGNGGKQVYCWRCEPWAYLEDGGVWMKWIAGGLVALLLLKSLGGC